MFNWRADMAEKTADNKRQKLKNRIFSKKNLSRFANGVVIGSVVSLSYAAVINAPQSVDISDHKDKFPLDSVSLNITPSHQGKTVLLSNLPKDYASVSYKVDTVVVDTNYLKRDFRTFGGFVPETKSISFNYFKVDTAGMPDDVKQRELRNAKYFNSEKSLKENIIHEVTHLINDEKGLKRFGISLFQFAKICVHDEISANISQLLDMRKKYLETKDFNVFRGKYPFYIQALKDKKFQPDSTKIPTSTELELIINGMREWWLQKNQNYYEKTHFRMAQKWFDKSFFYRLKEKAFFKNLAKKHNEEYMRRLSNCYSFNIELEDKKGSHTNVSVNFAKFMNKDVDISDELKSKLKSYANVSFREGHQRYKKALANDEYIQASEAQKIRDEGVVVVQKRNVESNVYINSLSKER